MVDNLKLRNTKTEIEKSQKEDTEINEKLNGINREMLTEKEPLITQQTKLFREKANIEGSLSEMRVTIIIYFIQSFRYIIILFICKKYHLTDYHKLYC